MTMIRRQPAFHITFAAITLLLVTAVNAQDDLVVQGEVVFNEVAGWVARAATVSMPRETLGSGRLYVGPWRAQYRPRSRR